MCVLRKWTENFILGIQLVLKDKKDIPYWSVVVIGISTDHHLYTMSASRQK